MHKNKGIEVKSTAKPLFLKTLYFESSSKNFIYMITKIAKKNIVTKNIAIENLCSKLYPTNVGNKGQRSEKTKKQKK